MKRLIVVLCLLVLSGCSIDYKVQFNTNNTVSDYLYTEELKINFDGESKPHDWGELINSRTRIINLRNEFFPEAATYEITLKNNYMSYEKYFNDKYFLEYVGNYKYTEGEECISTVVFNDNFKGKVYGDEILLPYAEKVSISVILPFKVVSSNATKVNGKTYIWELSENNKLDSIYVKYKNPKNDQKINEISFDILIAVIVVLAGVFVYIIISKNKKSNAL